jgi:alkylation response protein AidB-like acyl-CoA dehydrogenase
LIYNSIGRSETIAELEDEANNVWSVKGFKWFSSATTADMTMLLARTVDPKTGTVNPGSKGLSLYLAELRKEDGTLNGVRVHRLKDKYGTKALPTAELELVDMKATLMGKPHRGVPNITAILNITRIYSVAGTLAGVASSLAVAKDFARKREVSINCSLTVHLFFQQFIQPSIFICTTGFRKNTLYATTSCRNLGPAGVGLPCLGTNDFL